MIEKQKEIAQITKLLQDEKNIILYGAEGSGKQTIAQQLVHTLSQKNFQCIHCRFDENFSRNTDPILNIIHQFAQSFDATQYDKEHFNLIDFVYCEKYDLLPRNFFQTDLSPNLASEIFSLTEKIVDLTSLGVGGKMVNITQNIYKLAKESKNKKIIHQLKTQNREDMLLTYRIPILSHQEKQTFVILSNYDHYTPKSKEYLYALTTVNPKVRFLLIEKSPMLDEKEMAPFSQIHLEGFCPQEAQQYLDNRLGSSHQVGDIFQQEEFIPPAYLDAFCTILEKEEHELDQIRDILDQDSSLWADISKNLSQDKKDILILLALCDHVDRHVFECFFENLFFANYIPWFHEPLFLYENQKVSLKSYYKNTIAPHSNPLLLQTYYERLLKVHLQLLETSIKQQKTHAVHDKLNHIFHLCRTLSGYQENTSSYQDGTLEILEKYRNLSGAFGLESMFLSEYQELFQQYTGEKQLICRVRILESTISQGKYDIAQDYLLPNWEEHPPSLHLLHLLKSSLTYYQNKQTSIHGETRSDILLSQYLLQMLETLSLPMSEYYNYSIYLNTYLAKAYMAGIAPEKSREYLEKSFTIPREAIFLFHLYKNIAFTYMVSGELYTQEGETTKATEDLQRAIEFYQYTTTQDRYDWESHLHLGLVHKRISENYQQRNQREKAEEYMLQGIAIYEKVRKQNPTLIDVYQKIGYAYSELGAYLMAQEKETPSNSTKSEEYCRKSLSILEKGLDYLQSIGEDHRQIRNALCQVNRSLFSISADPSYLENSFQHARKSILCARENVLGYMEFFYSGKTAKESNLFSSLLHSEVQKYVLILENMESNPDIIQLGKNLL